jgi:hypothetical protein
MSTEALAAVVVAVLGSGGLIGGIVALLRVRPESGRLIVEAAEGAVVVQSGVIDQLRREISGLREDLDEELERRTKCEERLDKAEDEIGRLHAALRLAGIADG